MLSIANMRDARSMPKRKPPEFSPREGGSRRPALRIALIYALFGAIWIIASDRILAMLVPDIGRLTVLSTYKGWFYVAITAILVYLLVWRQLQRLLSLQLQLRTKDAAFRRYVEGLPVGVFRSSLQRGGRFLLINRATAEMFGYASVEEFLQRRADEFFVSQDCRDRILKTLLERRRIFGEAVALRKCHGEPIWVALTASLVEDEETGERYIDGVVVDETERRQTEQQLRLLWRALNQADEGIIITDTQHAILYANPAFERISGYELDEVIGKDIALLRSNRHDGAFYEQIRETVERGECWRGQITQRRKDGANYEEEVSIAPVLDNAGAITHHVLISRDISHEAQLERQLRQAQKMEAIGRMAGGIAHDFNNILAAIIGYADLAHMDLPPEHPVHEYIGEVLTASRRARDIVQQMLAFSRQAQQRPTPIRPAKTVEEAMILVRSAVPSSIRIETDIDSDCPAVMIDSTQLHQVVMNLVTNAWQAIGTQNGELRVGLHAVTIAGSEGNGNADRLEDGDYICLSVSDTGQGMDSETMQRIFDPYYTTKGVGEGTGLGLATVHAIVENSGGAIFVDSEVGKGAQFRIYLPVTLQPEEIPDDNNNIEPGQGEGILLIDDEFAVLNPTRAQLERAGYRVSSFTDARRAVECLRASPESFSVIITDHTMPGLTGVSLAALCREIRPDIPIILVTGHGNVTVQQAAQAAGIAEILTKPVRVQELCRILNQILHPAKNEDRRPPDIDSA